MYNPCITGFWQPKQHNFNDLCVLKMLVLVLCAPRETMLWKPISCLEITAFLPYYCHIFSFITVFQYCFNKVLFTSFMCEKMRVVDKSFMFREEAFVYQREIFPKTLTETKQVINRDLAKRQVYFFSCDNKSRDARSELVKKLSYWGSRIIFFSFVLSPPSLVCGSLPQTTRWLLAFQPPWPHSRLNIEGE